MKSKYIPIIGIEVHIELSTKSKMFCECPAYHFGKEPNSQVCPVCLGLPGALPYPNKDAIEKTIKFGSVFGCAINQNSKFDRKHYFYPDLPKAYQISQYDSPMCYKGRLEMKEEGINVRVRRIHLEEDTGKLIHKTVDGEKVSLVDFNRSGVPLLELVTEPDFNSVFDVVVFLKEIQLMARYLGISSADMEKGSMRLEANISVARKDDKKLPDYKVELKNINSFKFLEKALYVEIKRQEEYLQRGKSIIQETRGYNESQKKTFSQRTKEEEQDYRYFPEPDIPPLEFSKDYIKSIAKDVNKLPDHYRNIFLNEFKLPKNYVNVLVNKKRRSEHFIRSVELGNKLSITPKKIADLIVNSKYDDKYPQPADLIKFIKKLSKKKYADDKEIEKAVNRIIKDNKKAVEDFNKGKLAVVGFLLGSTQKILKGTGDPEMIKNELLRQLKK